MVGMPYVNSGTFLPVLIPIEAWPAWLLFCKIRLFSNVVSANRLSAIECVCLLELLTCGAGILCQGWLTRFYDVEKTLRKFLASVDCKLQWCLEASLINSLFGREKLRLVIMLGRFVGQTAQQKIPGMLDFRTNKMIKIWALHPDRRYDLLTMYMHGYIYLLN